MIAAGSRVRARYLASIYGASRTKVYGGVVAAAREEAGHVVYDIVYDDGDLENGVLAVYVRREGEAAPTAGVRAAAVSKPAANAAAQVVSGPRARVPSRKMREATEKSGGSGARQQAKSPDESGKASASGAALSKATANSSSEVRAAGDACDGEALPWVMLKCAGLSSYQARPLQPVDQRPRQPSSDGSTDASSKPRKRQKAVGAPPKAQVKQWKPAPSRPAVAEVKQSKPAPLEARGTGASTAH